MLVVAFALYIQSLNLADLSVEQRRFLIASNDLAQVAARCKTYVRPDFRDRATQQATAEGDPFLSAVMVEGLRRYDDIVSIQGTLPPVEEDVCNSQLAEAIVELATAHFVLVQSRAAAATENW